MKKFRVPTFSFHTEPFWILVSSFFIPVIGIAIAIFVTLIRKLFV